MHNRFPRPPQGRPHNLINPAFDPARLTLREQKLAAWALTVGVHTPSRDAGPVRSPHRGQLPDIDLTQIDRARLSWRERLFGWFG